MRLTRQGARHSYSPYFGYSFDNREHLGVAECSRHWILPRDSVAAMALGGKAVHRFADNCVLVGQPRGIRDLLHFGGSVFRSRTFLDVTTFEEFSETGFCVGRAEIDGIVGRFELESGMQRDFIGAIDRKFCHLEGKGMVGSEQGGKR